MSKKLVAHFSASESMAEMAKTLAGVTGADLYEIEPAVKYTEADLDWTNRQSRSSIEMKDQAKRPALGGKPFDASEDDVFVGFPIWWAWPGSRS